jgi:hypothetical protein
MATAKPPPLPPRQLSRSRARHPVPSPSVYTTDEEPTKRQGIEFRVALLAKYFRECAPEDQAYLLQLAEGYAARNS